MNITEKLLEARKHVKSNPMTKDGHNQYSNFDYFTPDQVSQLVHEACNAQEIITLFNLKKDQFGLFGELTLQDIKDPKEVLTFEMRTEIASMKATNLTQQMGGCDTYTRRYLLMSVFCITDNNLDFDSQDNRQQAPVEAPQLNAKVKIDILACTTLEELERFYNGFNEDEKKLYKEIVTKHKAKLS